MKILFLVDPSNPIKLQAIEDALKDYSETVYYQKITPLEKLDIRPIKRSDMLASAEQQAKNLLVRLSVSIILEYDDIYSIGIQKGTNLLDDDPPCLTCRAVVIKRDNGECGYGLSDSIPLPDRMRQLVKDEGMELYLAYKAAFGEKVSNKVVSLYEFITGKPEYLWISKAIQNALIPFHNKTREFYE